ncbi:HRDC domain-containing protein [Microbacterium sp. STN6]|uniref:ribonuclease D n=1 Tax=Microbacterium sp. STN6 TaxID=2995588 RepID=UPI002260EDC8|nr:HRDC domain-containing protein [Microbacterium sp. STN6]MCX7522449.1 HRDC domain-containing protein [Microbacterium sp. STN6]
MTDRDVVDTPEAYALAIEALASGHGPLAVDAERASGFRYSQRAYLIQIFRRGSGTFLLDPPALGRLDDLNAVIGGDEWVLHAASQDLPCLREVGLDPHTIFDTELSARLLGMPRVGLGTVVEELLGIHLAKEHSAADWSTRPLPQSWLTYAALDVELLVDLRDIEAEMLDAAGKAEIAAQEFQAELDKKPKPARAEPWRRLSGVHSIRGLRSLAVARSLWEARDQLARELDVSPGRLVPDASLTAAAIAMPASKRDLAALKAFSGRASRTELDRWWAAIEEGVSTDDLPVLRPHADTMPPPRAWAERNPEAHERLKHARAALAAISEERSIPVENLLLPEAVRRLCWSPPAELTPAALADAMREHDARPWQIEACAQRLSQAFVEASQSAAEPAEDAS